MKKSKTTTFLISLISVLILYSCTSLVEEIELPVLPPPIVVHAYLYPGMDEINLVLNYAENIGGYDNNPGGSAVQNAFVLIKSEHGDSIILNYSAFLQQYTATLEEHTIEAGTLYFLHILHQDFDPITSAVRVPYLNDDFYPVLVDSVIVSYRREYFINCYIYDTPGEKNYYQLYGNAEIETECYTEEGLVTDTSFRSLFGFSPLLTDENIDGQTIVQQGKFSTSNRFFPDTCYTTPVNINLRLFSLEENTYHYFQSVEEFLDASDNPFQEQQNLYTNIENGLGIFGAYALSEKSFCWDTIIP